MPPTNSDTDLESIASLQERPRVERRKSAGPKYVCSIAECGRSFMRLDQLDRHEYQHTGIKKHACFYDGCDKEYSIATHLKRHLRNTHERQTPPQKTVPCAVTECEKMFHSVCNMQRHVREVHENPKVYRCSHCGEKFTQKLKMRRHEINKHTGVFPYSCSKCSKGFYQEWQHTRHEANCKVYPCAGCTLQFDKWSLYLKHCKETHHGRRYYQCEHCERLYAKPSELKKHVAAKHMDDGTRMNYTCTQDGCDRAYAYERNLRQHMRVTHGGQRFECKERECERVFSSAQNLAKHLERDHNCDARRQQSANSEEKTKVKRKRRKDAGQPIVSHLAQLSGLAVDKELDRLLREREGNALEMMTGMLTADQMETATTDSDNEAERDLGMNDCGGQVQAHLLVNKSALAQMDVDKNSEIGLDYLVAAALADT